MVNRRWASIGTAFLFAVLPLPAIGASVLDRRLLRLTRDPDLTPKEADEVGSALSIARAIPVNLPNATRVQVYRATKQSGLKDADSPALAKSADEMVRYSRAVTFKGLFDPSLSAGSTEARRASRAAAPYVVEVLSGSPMLPTRNVKAAAEAVRRLTEAIDSSVGAPDDREVMIGALIMRATIYIYTYHATAALADAKRLELLGYTDLSNVLALEGIALNLLGKREDFEQAVQIFTLALQLEPPAVKGISPLFVDAYGNRAKAYYGIGQFSNSIEDMKRVLELIPKKDPRSPVYHFYINLAYSSLVASSLRLGDFEMAKTTAVTWSQINRDDIYPRMTIAQIETAAGRQHWLDNFDSNPPVY